MLVSRKFDFFDLIYFTSAKLCSDSAGGEVLRFVPVDYKNTERVERTDTR